jgi:hypothetical protein
VVANHNTTAEDFTHLESPSPEDLIIKKEKYNSLSREASIIWLLLIWCPEEWVISNGRLARKYLFSFLHNEFRWSWKTIRNSLEELHEFVRSL